MCYEIKISWGEEDIVKVCIQALHTCHRNLPKSSESIEDFYSRDIARNDIKII